MSNEWFGIVRWCDEDIRVALEDMGHVATEENIALIHNEIAGNRFFKDAMIETGWDSIRSTIQSTLGDPEDTKRRDFSLQIPSRNTLLSYMYRDGSNYKIQLEEILAGGLTEDEIADFNKKFDEKYFYPAKLGLKDTTFTELGYSPYDDDPDWHEFCYLEPTDREPTTKLTVDEFVQAINYGEIIASF